MINAQEFGLKPIDIEKVQIIFKNYPAIERVIIYGSRAKGNYKPYSDIDITLVGLKIDLTLQNKIENELDDLLLPYKFDVSVFHKIQNEDLVDHINRIGKIIFVRN